MNLLAQLPLDVWMTVFAHVDEQLLVETFENVYLSGGLRVPPLQKLNAFWHIVTEARQRSAVAVRKDSNMAAHPCGDSFKECAAQLYSMGLTAHDSVRVTRDSGGSLQRALVLLQWA